MNEVVVFVVIVLILIACGVCLILVCRHYEKLLEVAVKRAQKSEQLKSVFIDNISRTLRSPLKAVEGMCSRYDRRGGEFYMDSEYDKKTLASVWFPCEMKDTHKE